MKERVLGQPLFNICRVKVLNLIRIFSGALKEYTSVLKSDKSPLSYWKVPMVHEV